MPCLAAPQPRDTVSFTTAERRKTKHRRVQQSQAHTGQLADLLRSDAWLIQPVARHHSEVPGQHLQLCHVRHGDQLLLRCRPAGVLLWARKKGRQYWRSYVVPTARCKRLNGTGRGGTKHQPSKMRRKMPCYYAVQMTTICLLGNIFDIQFIEKKFKKIKIK